MTDYYNWVVQDNVRYLLALPTECVQSVSITLSVSSDRHHWEVGSSIIPSYQVLECTVYVSRVRWSPKPTHQWRDLFVFLYGRLLRLTAAGSITNGYAGTNLVRNGLVRIKMPKVQETL